MKKILLLASAVAVFCSISAFADTKIGVLDLNKVLLGAPQVTAMQTDLKKKFDPRGAELVKMQKDVQSEIDSYNKTVNGGKTKADDLKKTQGKIMDDQKKLQDMQANFQRDLINAQNQSMQTILTQIQTIVNKVAADQKFDLVITKVSTAFNAPSMEITDQVLAAMKK